MKIPIGLSCLLLLMTAGTPVAAATDSARIVQYIYDGNKTITRVIITAFGGPPMVSVTSTSRRESRDLVFELEPEVFEEIWSGFERIDVLRNSDDTESTTNNDSETHHIFFTQEVSSAGSNGRSYSLAAADATPEFLDWLRLFLPADGGG